MTDNTPKKFPGKGASVPATNAQVPAVRSVGALITPDRYAQSAAAVYKVSALLANFGERKLSKVEHIGWYTTRPTVEQVDALLASPPQQLAKASAQFAELDRPATVEFMLKEMGKIAAGKPLSNNISQKVFLDNLCDLLERQDPKPTFWELRETRLAVVGKPGFADTGEVMEVFAEKRKEAAAIRRRLRPEYIAQRREHAKQLKARWAKEGRGQTEAEYFELLESWERGAVSDEEAHRQIGAKGSQQKDDGGITDPHGDDDGGMVR
jgi:hypothetical protein